MIIDEGKFDLLFVLPQLNSSNCNMEKIKKTFSSVTQTREQRFRAKVAEAITDEIRSSLSCEEIEKVIEIIVRQNKVKSPPPIVTIARVVFITMLCFLLIISILNTVFGDRQLYLYYIISSINTFLLIALFIFDFTIQNELKVARSRLYKVLEINIELNTANYILKNELDNITQELKN